jgi:hypothetical protein
LDRSLSCRRDQPPGDRGGICKFAQRGADAALNLKTAKALGLDVPDKLLALTEEVIE